MIYQEISPVHKFGNLWVKREDLAHWSALEYPSGSKVRQYMTMALTPKAGPPPSNKVPCLVGCSANSAMQIYVAATARQLGAQGIVCIPKRKVKTDATKYAERMGAEIHEIKPGYLSVVRKFARQIQIDKEHVVAWDRAGAIEDTIRQCQNIPEGVKRIIVPTGSGLTAAGILVGTNLEVVAVCTSPMSDKEKIIRLANSTRKFKGSSDRLTVIPPLTPYDIPQIAELPDGTPLDPFYSAKAWDYMKENDLFWPPGLRPVISMPEICQKHFKDWKGPDNG